MKQRIYIDTSVVGGYFDEEFRETIKNEKKIDAVKMMREIRDKISLETKGMTLTELKLYIQKRIKENNFKPVGQ